MLLITVCDVLLCLGPKNIHHCVYISTMYIALVTLLGCVLRTSVHFGVYKIYFQ